MDQAEILELYSRSKLWSATYRTDEVKLFLTSEINRRGLKKDERFPLNEREIAKRLNVSRVTVNKAWSELAREGLVELKQGVGVKILDPEGILPDSRILDAFFEIRKITETELTLLAIKNATEENLEVIEVALNKLINALKELNQIDLEKIGYLEDRDNLIFRVFLGDVGFHAAVRKAAKDTWLEIICEVAEAKGQAIRMAGLSIRDRALDLIETHSDIFRAIKLRDDKDAIQAVERHFQIAREMNETFLSKT